MLKATKISALSLNYPRLSDWRNKMGGYVPVLLNLVLTVPVPAGPAASSLLSSALQGPSQQVRNPTPCLQGWGWSLCSARGCKRKILLSYPVATVSWLSPFKAFITKPQTWQLTWLRSPAPWRYLKKLKITWRVQFLLFMSLLKHSGEQFQTWRYVCQTIAELKVTLQSDWN